MEFETELSLGGTRHRIIDLVGDKLREVFGSHDVGIRWVDEKANLIHHLYEFEHGVRLELPPSEK